MVVIICNMLLICQDQDVRRGGEEDKPVLDPPSVILTMEIFTHTYICIYKIVIN